MNYDEETVSLPEAHFFLNRRTQEYRPPNTTTPATIQINVWLNQYKLTRYTNLTRDIWVEYFTRNK